MEILNQRPMRFVYARYQVTGHPAADLAEELPIILAALQSVRQPVGKYLWVIGDTGERSLNGEKLLFGRLGKTARESVGPSGEGLAHSFDRNPMQGKKAACSNFFIHPSSSIIVFEDKQQLPADKFLKKFKLFWEMGQAGKMCLDYLKSEPEIFAIINHWDKITAAKFDLAPVNARLREDLAPLNNLIKKTGASRASFRLEGGANGLATGNSIIQQGVAISAAGYGEFSLKGVEKQEGASLNSKSCRLSNELVEADDLESLAPVILSGIRKILMQINSPESNTNAESA